MNFKESEEGYMGVFGGGGKGEMMSLNYNWRNERSKCWGRSFPALHAPNSHMVTYNLDPWHFSPTSSRIPFAHGDLKTPLLEESKVSPWRPGPHRDVTSILATDSCTVHIREGQIKPHWEASGKFSLLLSLPEMSLHSWLCLADMTSCLQFCETLSQSNPAGLLANSCLTETM